MAPKKKQQSFRLPDRLTESYIIATSRRQVGIYGERFIDVLDHASILEKTGKLSGGIESIVQESDGSRTITFSIKRLMANTSDRNYDDAEAAMRKLESIFFEYRVNKVWHSRSLITDPDIDETNHVAKFRVPAEIWEAVKNKDAGFRIYNPEMAYVLSSDYTYRLYKLVCNQKEPFRRKIDDIKAMLGCTEKYKRYVDFYDRVLEPARQELMNSAEYYFDVFPEVSAEAKKSATGRGRRPYDQLLFVPKFNEKLRNPSTHAVAAHYNIGSAVDALPNKLHQYLNRKYDFTDNEILNSRTIIEAYDIMRAGEEDLLAYLLDNTDIIDSAKGSKKAFLIGFIKRHIDQRYQIHLGAARKSDAGDSPAPENAGKSGGLGDLFGDENI